jgi:hypothetical protein
MAKAKAEQDPNQNLPTLSNDEREIPEIQQAGATLLDVRTRRIALNAEEKTAQDLVISAMQKHDRDYYSFKGLEVYLEEGKTKAKVKHASNGDGDEE